MANLQKREKILMWIAGLVAVFFVIDRIVCSENVQQLPQVAEKPVVKKLHSQSSNVVKSESKQTQKPFNRKDNNEFTKLKVWGRDPFVGTIRLTEFDSSSTDSSDFVLKGVIWKGDDAQVLIGNEILKKGDRVGNLEILEIEKDRVVCKKNGKIVTLLLKEDDILH